MTVLRHWKIMAWYLLFHAWAVFVADLARALRTGALPVHWSRWVVPLIWTCWGLCLVWSERHRTQHTEQYE